MVFVKRLVRLVLQFFFMHSWFFMLHVVGRSDSGAVPLVMCLWNRPERLPAVLAVLNRQVASKPVRLILWVNNRGDARRYLRDVRSGLRGKLNAISSVEVVVSPVNVGGLARFYVVRRLFRDGYKGPVLMLDDDQDISELFVEDLLQVYTPRSVSGVWAWVCFSGYWDRRKAELSGEQASYVGTGGCVLDSSLTDSTKFFRRLPRRFMFIEDLWASFYAAGLGWDLRRVDTPVDFVLSERDQGEAPGFADRKVEFFDWLVRRKHRLTV